MAGHADVLFNASVLTQDTLGTRAEAVAWREGAIVAVGSSTEVALVAGPGARSWDAAGATVLPGFIDAHHHPCIVALYGGVVRLAPPAVTDIASLQCALAAAASTLPPGQWLVATEWDEFLLAERRPPTRRELDDAVRDRPLFAMHYSCHRALANSRALELAGIGRGTPDPRGGLISRGVGGLPDGLLVERGMSRVETLARASTVAHDAEGFLSRLGRHHRDMAAAGITRVVDATVPADLAVLYREAARRGLLAIPTVMMPVSTSGYLETPWDALDGPVTGHEEGPLVVGPLKLVFDGAPGCAMCLDWWQAAGATLGSMAMSVRDRSLDPMRTALSLEPRVGRKVRTGINIYPRSEARDIVR
ncbi:MAG: amidohydrolase family protein, partial [Deltaproteobacteria bacterium]